ncbi:MFS family permease [Aminobacter aganoensis]|uniref:MFS family permease n=2 Tax=Phyllobacteriaceae TaxID=69277 RepID=A0A7X0F606_9HYPH|nr:MFS family permease [Aminobacter aganoensis]
MQQAPDTGEGRGKRAEPGQADTATRSEVPVAPQPAAPAPAPPAFVPKPMPMAAAYVCASVVLALTQGLGMNLVAANVPQIQGSIGATATETTWLVAAYMAPNVSLALALIKIRTQYGLRNFAELSILGFVVACVLNLFISDLQSALAVRFMSGIAAAPMSTLAFLYMLESFSPEKKLNVGLPLALTSIALGSPVARLISPALFDIGGFHAVTMFELGMAMVAFALVYALPLAPQPRARVIGKLDVISYLLIATGFGATAIVLVLGRLYWWLEAPWIGVLLALAVACITIAAVIELNRENPLLDIRWLASPPILHFTGVLLMFRLVLSEQTLGASSLFQALGLSNEQTRSVYGVILVASIAGGLTCAALMKHGKEERIHIAALILIAIGAYMDSRATNLTRPEQVFYSQALIAFAGALILPPAMKSGLMSALKKGPNYILSFIIVFLTTQSLGGLLGSAVFTTFVTSREQFHHNMLVEDIALTDPLVAQRVAQLGGAYSRVITDKALLNAEGLQLLSQQATREAYVLAYNDAFLLITAIALVSLVLLLAHIAIVALRNRTAAPQVPATT